MKPKSLSRIWSETNTGSRCLKEDNKLQVITTRHKEIENENEQNKGQ